jgi:hypothetical protein
MQIGAITSEQAGIKSGIGSADLSIAFGAMLETTLGAWRCLRCDRPSDRQCADLWAPPASPSEIQRRYNNGYTQFMYAKA